MKKSIICQLLTTSLLLFSSLCFGQPISSTELINNAKNYDGKVVTFAGEVIGDVMRRGGSAWVNVYDGQNAVGIWIRNSLLKDITYTGSYKSIGDAVEITGTFHRACPEHGGDLDIHALGLRKVASGRLVQDKPNLAKRSLAIIFLGALILIWIFTKFLRK
jgi:hypothetical protein